MAPPPSPSSPPVPRRRSHLRSAAAGTLLHLLSIFPAGLPDHHAPAPPPSSDPSPPPDSGGAPTGEAAPEEAAAVLDGSGDVGVVVGVRKEGALLNGGIGQVGESAGGDGCSSRDCGGMDAAAMADGEKGGILPIEVWLDCRMSSGLLLGDVEVEDMILDQESGDWREWGSRKRALSGFSN